MEGKICLNILREDWKPVLSISSVIYGLQFLFLVGGWGCSGWGWGGWGWAGLGWGGVGQERTGRQRLGLQRLGRQLLCSSAPAPLPAAPSR